MSKNFKLYLKERFSNLVNYLNNCCVNNIEYIMLHEFMAQRIFITNYESLDYRFNDKEGINIGIYRGISIRMNNNSFIDKYEIKIQYKKDILRKEKLNKVVNNKESKLLTQIYLTVYDEYFFEKEEKNSIY